MALLQPSRQSNKIQARIHIDKELHEEVKAYCEFADIKKPDEFFEQAAQFVFKKDKDWQQAKKCRHGSNQGNTFSG